MFAARIIEAVDVFKDRQFRRTTRVPRVSPDQLGFDGFEERLDYGVIVAITFATHGCFEPVLPQAFLIVVRTILVTAIRVMNAPS